MESHPSRDPHLAAFYSFVGLTAPAIEARIYAGLGIPEETASAYAEAAHEPNSLGETIRHSAEDLASGDATTRVAAYRQVASLTAQTGTVEEQPGPEISPDEQFADTLVSGEEAQWMLLEVLATRGFDRGQREVVRHLFSLLLPFEGQEEPVIPENGELFTDLEREVAMMAIIAQLSVARIIIEMDDVLRAGDLWQGNIRQTAEAWILAGLESIGATDEQQALMPSVFEKLLRFTRLAFERQQEELSQARRDFRRL